MENNKWRIEVQGGGQIADTGDYSDPYYVLTDGNIELVTKDEIDESDADSLLDWFNIIGAKWEDWKLADKEYELSLEKEHCKKWKEASANLHMAIKSMQIPDNPVIAKIREDAMTIYEQCENNLP